MDLRKNSRSGIKDKKKQNKLEELMGGGEGNMEEEEVTQQIDPNVLPQVYFASVDNTPVYEASTQNQTPFFSKRPITSAMVGGSIIGLLASSFMGYGTILGG
jgi:hypothetical protein